MPRLSKIGAAALAAFGFSSGGATAVTASYLQVAGGGGGGDGTWPGGGGAGGYLTGTTSLTLTSSYTVVVGAGGAGAISSSYGTNGSNSSITGLTASVGGGAGAGGNVALQGNSGGSGGGGTTNGGTGGAGTAGQGSAGGGASGGQNGGGGGGAGAVGGNASGSGAGGSGGVGLASSISGTSTYYAGGGGGYGTPTPGAGGNGGGATGGTGGAAGGNGTSNTGGGGGGTNAGSGGKGGSGIVIISYTGAQQFGGGIVTSVGGNTIHTFNTSGTLSPLSSLSASYLIVAGGGGGGSSVAGTNSGSGAGAGGMLTGSGVTIDTNSTYLVTVGAGGSGAATGSTSNGSQGSSSSFSSVATTAVGGGSGANNSGTATGGTGGSGGGSAGTAAGSATSGQGNAGGTSTAPSLAGGGGAGAVGGNASTVATGGNGGVGLTSSISGTSTYYAGGGGGGGTVTAGTGGSGGGGAGGQSAGPSNGTANLGGGGGGAIGASTGYNGGSGGSGIVIISYAGSTQQMAGGSVTITGGNVIHTFLSSGYLTPLTYYRNSLRFRSSATAYLNRTFSTPTSALKYTFSAWVKRGALSVANAPMFSASTSDGATIRFEGSDSIRWYDYNGAFTVNLTTTAVYRDPAAWYHVVCAYDSTQATSSDRAKMYVNGVQVTAFSSSTYPTLNLASVYFNTAIAHNIGRNTFNTANLYDGEMTAINFIDGQGLTANSFGTFNSYGVWQPINYGGSYGTNGFYLPFTNTASTTTLGYDFSPQGNNWTTNNISLTAGATYDSMTDVPTLTSATAANYCTLNPLQQSNVTLSNGNLTYLAGTNGALNYPCGSTLGVTSGQFYWEITVTSLTLYLGVGIASATDMATIVRNDLPIGFTASSYNVFQSGDKANNSTTSAYQTGGYATGNVIGVAFDATNGKIWFGKNNVFPNSGDPVAGTNAAFTSIPANTYLPALSGNSSTLSANFGQQPFVYTPPTGYVGVNTYNL